MLKYAVEPFSKIIDEARPILEAHWLEIGLDRDIIPLDVDYEKYCQLHENHKIIIVTARNEGALVGYIAAIISSHLHYRSTLFATLDVFYLKPEFRRGMNGLNLFLEMERALKWRDVRKVIGQTKLEGKDVSAVYRYLGWKPIETLFAKVL